MLFASSKTSIGIEHEVLIISDVLMKPNVVTFL